MDYEIEHEDPSIRRLESALAMLSPQDPLWREIAELVERRLVERAEGQERARERRAA